MSRERSSAIAAVGAGLGLVLAVSDCGPYTPSSPLGGKRKWAHARTIGCLDVRTEIVRDHAVPVESPVVDVRFANVCTRGVRVDLSKLRVLARFPDGAIMPLTVHDPHGEIEPRLLAPIAIGHEAIEFDPEKGRPRLTHLCIEVDGVDADHQSSTAPPMCFVRILDDMLPIVETRL